jgi:sterol desaturase/sphingolipid hydroxylase (fatty acid hydroxylase superfamily)
VTGGVLGAFIGFGAVFGLADITFLLGQPAWVMGLAWVGMVLVGAFVVGPFMKIIFNSPDMHIWHHVEHLPAEKRYGVNFGITLAIWDYIFGTVHLPHSGRDEELGFPGVEEFPSTFTGQIALQLDKKS